MQNEMMRRDGIVKWCGVRFNKVNALYCNGCYIV
jgi:hypothetical protein